MKLDLKELEQYPEILSKEQFRIVAHMSKRTATYLLESKILPSENTGGKTRCYRIKKQDIITFFEDLEMSPKKIIMPPDWYSTKKDVKVSPYAVRSLPKKVFDKDYLRKFYTTKLKDYKDIISVTKVAEFTGYRSSTVTQWIRDGKLKALQLPGRYIIPKVYLIDWLSSEAYNNIERKTKKHVYALWWMDDFYEDND